MSHDLVLVLASFVIFSLYTNLVVFFGNWLDAHHSQGRLSRLNWGAAFIAFWPALGLFKFLSYVEERKKAQAQKAQQQEKENEKARQTAENILRQRNQFQECFGFPAPPSLAIVDCQQRVDEFLKNIISQMETQVSEYKKTRDPGARESLLKANRDLVDRHIHATVTAWECGLNVDDHQHPDFPLISLPRRPGRSKTAAT